ncbi:MAG TPA: hypothetical protein VKA89_07080 [Solirubrobacterales bacterium]|nr:hypothetical protein [Solirubrobacterales bacterium]
MSIYIQLKEERMKNAGSRGMLRLAIVAALAVCGALLVPAAASAAPTNATSFNKAPVVGHANNGKPFAGTFTVERFANRSGQLYAVGRLVGKAGNRSVSRTVFMPARLISTGANGATASATCEILTLQLGPLDLNLLGLRVQLNRINLRITAIEGPGNLLGNLLCALAGLLNGPTAQALPIGQQAGLLNIVLQLVNTPALLNL